MDRLFIALGSLLGLGAVAMSALAAHGLAPDARTLAQSGIEIEGWHALALLAVSLWLPRGGRLAALAGAAFVLGTLLFCGDVYSLALGGPRLGPLAPAGGFALMLGWALLAASAVKARGSAP